MPFKAGSPTTAALILSIALLMATVPAGAQSTYEQVLAPFDTLVADSGVRWSAELRVRNSSDVEINLFPEQCSWLGRVSPCWKKILVPPQTAMLLDVLDSPSVDYPGILLYVPTAHVEDIHFSLMVRDSDSEDSVGTTIPVVRRERFRTRFTIPGIPISSEQRRTLRIYQAVAPVQSVFRIRVVDETTNAVLADRDCSRVFPTDPPSPLLVPATVDCSDTLSAEAVGGAQHVSVVVERTFPAQLDFWPMVSVTGNRNNSVAVFTPN